MILQSTKCSELPSKLTCHDWLTKWFLGDCTMFPFGIKICCFIFLLTKTRKISCSSISILCLYRDLLKIKIFSAKIGLWFHESYSDIITKLPKLFKLLSEQFIKLKFQSRDGLGAGKQVYVLLIYLYVFFWCAFGYVLKTLSLLNEARDPYLLLLCAHPSHLKY